MFNISNVKTFFLAWRWGRAIYSGGYVSFEHREHWCPLLWDLFSGQLWQWRPHTLKEERHFLYLATHWQHALYIDVVMYVCDW